MNSISLHNVLPAVFAKERDSRQSDVWLSELSIVAGETVLVEAQSGKGKSSLAAFVYGYRNDYEGLIEFDGQDIRRLSAGQWNELRRRHLSLMFQELRLFGELTALDNVLIKNKFTNHLSLTEIDAFFDRLGILDKKNIRADRLSYGQQQRVALVRALAQPFNFLIADEPISHIDDSNAQTVGELLTEQCRKQGAALIVTSIGKHINLPYNRVLKL